MDNDELFHSGGCSHNGGRVITLRLHGETHHAVRSSQPKLDLETLFAPRVEHGSDARKAVPFMCRQL